MQLPQNLKFRDAALSRAFAGKGRIPMSTFVERYIDGSIEVAGDLHDFLRARSACMTSSGRGASGRTTGSPGTRRSSSSPGSCRRC